MRTTITIEDGLLLELKKRAAGSGSTVSRMIEAAVRLTLHDRADRQKDQGNTRFELVTYGRGGRFLGHDPDKSSALLEAEDLERFRPTRRSNSASD